MFFKIFCKVLDSNNRERLESALSYPEDQVGALMDFDIVTIRDDISIEVALRYSKKDKKTSRTYR